MTAPLRGLTWDHPRGYLVLDALAAEPAPAVPVRWDRQSLEDFESRPLRTLADDFDLLVVDHPGLGEAVRDGALRPLDAIFGYAGELAEWHAAAIGASFDSYQLAGRQWALPLDAAAQVSVCRPDLMDGRPASWAQAQQAARANRTALCLGGPHALLMFSAICVAAGPPPAISSGLFVPEAAGTAALDIMADLLAHADREVSQRNPIGVLDAMAAADGPAYCPLVYGYVTYQRASRERALLAAFDAPVGPGGIGSVLGGTGVAVTRSCTQPTAAAALIRTLLSERVQVGLFAELGGQSSARRAWQDAEVDQVNGGFYSATRATVEHAWVRPRFAGYPAFQAEASAVLRDALLRGEPHAAAVRRVNELFARAEAPAAEGAVG
ncbi:MAG TPA: hypothetical protein VMV92_17490 [Streptosporangiaceae bacterium]|nr:hypothetical protein [Streptosporangiaceae bacterium]